MTPQLISLPALPGLNISLAISSSTLLVVLAIFFVIYLIISTVLFYHWTAYGMGSKGIYVGEILFVTVTIVLFLIAFISANYY